MTGDYDWKIKNAVEETSKLQKEILDELKESRQDNKKIMGNLLEAFNNVAKELRLLREELAPKTLDKSKLPSPLKGTGNNP
jgi:FtsZ-binding cell division protein ZapB